MTDPTIDYIEADCGCIKPGKHAGCPDPDLCPGCQPAMRATASRLCLRCDAALGQLILSDGHEGLEWITLWLADNLGQYIRHSTNLGGPGGNADAKMDHLVAVSSVMSEMQIAIIETAEAFADSRGITAPERHEGHLQALAMLRRWIGSLRLWEVASDTLSELLELREQAHAVAPWRQLHDPNADEYAAAEVYRAPAETTAEVCARFGVSEASLWKAKQRKKIQPVNEDERPLRWLPWDVFAWKHPAEAATYLERWGERTTRV